MVVTMVKMLCMHIFLSHMQTNLKEILKFRVKFGFSDVHICVWLLGALTFYKTQSKTDFINLVGSGVIISMLFSQEFSMIKISIIIFLLFLELCSTRNGFCPGKKKILRRCMPNGLSSHHETRCR